jgi:hypothetical protein
VVCALVVSVTRVASLVHLSQHGTSGLQNIFLVVASQLAMRFFFRDMVKVFVKEKRARVARMLVRLGLLYACWLLTVPIQSFC